MRFSESPTATKNPVRDHTQEEKYVRCRQWCERNSLSTADYIRRYVLWNENDIALEPCLVPYHVAPDVEHWILWFHDRTWEDADKCKSFLENRFLIWEAIVTFVPSVVNLGQFDRVYGSAVIWYENHPVVRSIPAIRHMHVFFRRNNKISGDLDVLRKAWIARSPFLAEEKAK